MGWVPWLLPAALLMAGRDVPVLTLWSAAQYRRLLEIADANDTQVHLIIEDAVARAVGIPNTSRK